MLIRQSLKSLFSKEYFRPLTLSVPGFLHLICTEGGLGGPPSLFIRNHHIRLKKSTKSSCAQKTDYNKILKVTESQSRESALVDVRSIFPRGGPLRLPSVQIGLMNILRIVDKNIGKKDVNSNESCNFKCLLRSGIAPF